MDHLTRWRLNWTVRHHDVLVGLTAEVDGSAELGSHFAPRAVVLHAVDLALARIGVPPQDVTKLVITIEKTEAPEAS
jgi:hypothetical protein